jgi:hypothetical protein
VKLLNERVNVNLNYLLLEALFNYLEVFELTKRSVHGKEE